MGKNNYLLLLFSSVLFSSYFVNGTSRKRAENLYSKLFSGYQRDIRPVYGSKLSVGVIPYLFSIKEFDEISGTLSSVGAISYFWFDSRLTWNASEYGNMTYLTIPSKRVWYPDLYLLNPAKEMEAVGDSNFIAEVNNKGYVTRSVGSIMKTTCSVDMTYFPFDEQMCTLDLMPWGYFRGEIHLYNHSNTIDMTYFNENAQWKVVNTEVKQYTLGSMDGLVKAFIHLKRRPEYFALNILAPIILLCILNPFVFLLPAESGERISFTVTIFLSLAVFMTLLSDNMPKSSEPMSRLSYFIIITLAFSTILCVLAIYIMRIHFRSEKRPIPKWMIKMLAILKCDVVCCTRKNGQVGNVDIIAVESKDMSNDSGFNMECGEKEQPLNWKDIAGLFDKIVFWYSFIFLIITISSMFLSFMI